MFLNLGTCHETIIWSILTRSWNVFETSKCNHVLHVNPQNIVSNKAVIQSRFYQHFSLHNSAIFFDQDSSLKICHQPELKIQKVEYHWLSRKKKWYSKDTFHKKLFLLIFCISRRAYLNFLHLKYFSASLPNLRGKKYESRVT